MNVKSDIPTEKQEKDSKPKRHKPNKISNTEKKFIIYDEYNVNPPPKSRIQFEPIKPPHEPKNKFEPPKMTTDQKPKNQSEKPTLSPKSKPENKIERSTPPANIKPKNKIERSTLPLNHNPKNKIEPYRIPPDHTPKNSIKQPAFPQNFIQKNAPNKPQITPNNKKDSIETSGNIKESIPEKLDHDVIKKECGRCHEIKLIGNFEFRNDSRKKKGYYRSICKDCRDEYKQIYSLRNKRKIILNIYNGILKGRCQKCGTGTERLPSLDFHHPFPRLKSQRINFGHKNWEMAMKKLESEKVNLECKNCHTKEGAKNYRKYESLVQNFDKKFHDKNLNAIQIEKAIGKFLKQNSEHIHVDHRPSFKRFVRKYTVISKLYNGKCVACEQITIKNNLPGLQFHHIDLKNPNRKQWKRLLAQPYPEIVKTLKRENCVAICANCQRMIHSHQFKKNYESIINSEYWDQIKQFYKKAESNIKKFIDNQKLKNEIEKPPLSPKSKPQNKIERSLPPANVKPKNKIERTKLPSNHNPKNKIEPRKIPTNYTPNKKILSNNPMVYKFKIIINIYQRKYKGMCAQCNADSKLLYAVDFHHSDPKIKGNTWNERRTKDWKETMKIFEKEKVIPLCGNCHSREQAKLFNEYKSVILKENIFNIPANKIDKILYEKVKNHETHYNRNIKFRVTEWLKKRSVIEQLYDGKCIGCNSTTVKNNLPALQFHHRSGLKEADNKLKWEKIKKYDIESICKKLIREDCVCLCTNCHKTVHIKNLNSIPTGIFGDDFKTQIKIYKDEIQQNIQNFELKPKKIKDPLQKKYEYGEAWKKYLTHIFKLSKENKNIKTLNLANSVGVNSRNTRKNIQKLLNRGLITIEGVHNNRIIKLTEKGRKELENI
ncbi:MAG: hypothetical protein ACFFCE_17925 [Promethearchaeota archaeon]